MTDKSTLLEINEFMQGASIFWRDPVMGSQNYPTNIIPKGLILTVGKDELVEEGLGFGLPVLKFGHEAIFPGNARFCRRHDGETTQITVEYDLNLVHRMSSRNNPINSDAFYAGKAFFSRLHRQYPPLRNSLTACANAIQYVAHLKTSFVIVPTAATISVVYSIYPHGRIHITLDLEELQKIQCAEVIICNEMGANHFDRYEDSNGVLLTGKDIGTWNEIQSNQGSLIDSRHGINFTISIVDGARLFRGRELIPGRLAWSGLNYVLTQYPCKFAYEILLSTTR